MTWLPVFLQLEVVGRINPHELDVIFSDTWRSSVLMGKNYATEQAYDGKVGAFLRERRLKCLDDFANIDGRDVEAQLGNGLMGISGAWSRL